MPRFFVSRDAIAGDRVRFDAAEAHHLARVRRLRPGALLEATDGAGRVLTVRLVALDRGAAWGTIVGEAARGRESPCVITLAQAILKGERMAWLVEKATELGVARVLPMMTERVVVRSLGEGTEGRRARWTRVARAAVKQCGRAVVPVIDPPRPFAAAVREGSRHDAAWLLREGGGVPVA